MKSRGIASNSSQPDEKGGVEIAANKLEGYSLGDIMWVESCGSLWWPAQVADENGVSGCLKPDSRPEGQILVRLYGSYAYVYADPVKCRSKFDVVSFNVLKQNNGCYREIFQKALEQDRLQFKSDQSSAQRSKSKEMTVGASKDKKPNQNKEKKSVELGSPSKTRGGDRITRAMKANMDPSRYVSGKGRTQLGADEFSVRTSPRRQSTATEQNGQHKKQKPATPSAGQTRAKFKRSCSSAEEGAEKTPGQDKLLSKHNSNTEPSARRVRVMQSLGLVAPPGSPFHANRQT